VVDSIKMDLERWDIMYVSMECIDLAVDVNQWKVLVNTVMNLRVP
jgi:hypothetical protein